MLDLGASGFARQSQMFDDEMWSEEEHACFVQALQEQSGGINWHVTAQRIGTKSAQQVGNFLAVSACCPTFASPSCMSSVFASKSSIAPPHPLFWSAGPIAVPCHRLKTMFGPSGPLLLEKACRVAKFEPQSTG
jgi:hypothetical protein